MWEALGIQEDEFVDPFDDDLLGDGADDLFAVDDEEQPELDPAADTIDDGLDPFADDGDAFDPFADDEEDGDLFGTGNDALEPENIKTETIEIEKVETKKTKKRAPAKKKPAANRPLSNVSDADLIKNYIAGNEPTLDIAQARGQAIAQARAGKISGDKMIDIVERLDRDRKNSRDSHKKEIAARLAERAAESSPNLLTAHGMSERELHRYAEFGGIKIFAADFSENSAAVQTVQKLAQENWLPPELMKYTERIVFTDQRNKDDAYWEEQYGKKDFFSAATGGDGSVVVYNGDSSDRATVSHEMGHNMAFARYGDPSPPPGSDFYAAAQKKGAPTEYGTNSIGEDFAESVYLYVEWLNKADEGKKFKKADPERFEIIKNLLKKNSTYGG
jgi:hypothetical protein